MSSIFPNWFTETMLLHRKTYGSEQMNGDITTERLKYLLGIQYYTNLFSPSILNLSSSGTSDKSEKTEEEDEEQEQDEQEDET
ncbi:unnamed protein product, partial [Rotaria sp. Silwood2]